jgi:hypothetical protein
MACLLAAGKLGDGILAGLAAHVFQRLIPRQDWLPLLRTLAATAGMALLLSMTGAFETHTVPVFARTLYWLTLLVAARLTAFAIETLGRSLVRSFNLDPPVWVAATLYLALATPAITFVILLVTVTIFQTPLRWHDYQSLLGPVLTITAASTVLHNLLHRVPYRSRAAKPPATQRPAILSRLPQALRDADIHAVSAEDHYLRIFTSAGEALIHMRFVDALKELDGIEGTQTHRSHWVARAAVTGVDRRRGKILLGVKGGLKLPVSRSFQNALKAGGWL